MQYLCMKLRGRWALRLAAALGGMVLLSGPVSAASGPIYRVVGPDGSVSYSDQPSPGAQQVPGLLVQPPTAAERLQAEARAEARINRQLDLAAELAAERRERTEDREIAARVRAELRESRARQQAATAERERREADRYPYVLPRYPYYDRGYHRGRDRWHEHRGQGPYRPEPEPVFEPPSPRRSRPLPPG